MADQRCQLDLIPPETEAAPAAVFASGIAGNPLPAVKLLSPASVLTHDMQESDGRVTVAVMRDRAKGSPSVSE